MQQSRDWVFTINNPTLEEEKSLEGLVGDRATYLVYGRETGDSGTPHLQGFVQLCSRSRRRAVSGLPGLSRAFLECRKGSPQQASEYCKKDGNFVEIGEMCQQGKRKDLDEVREAVRGGASELQLFEDHFSTMVRYGRGIQHYRNLLQASGERTPPRIYVIWGPTGVGKSRLARHFGEVFSLPDTTLRWWDGYNGQENVLLDDFDGEGVSIASFLRYFDRYSVAVPVKGGFVPFKAKTIWITSNACPDDWFPSVPQVKRDAVRRRLTKVVNLMNPLDFESASDIQRMKCLLMIE